MGKSASRTLSCQPTNNNYRAKLSAQLSTTIADLASPKMDSLVSMAMQQKAKEREMLVSVFSLSPLLTSGGRVAVVVDSLAH